MADKDDKVDVDVNTTVSTTPDQVGEQTDKPDPDDAGEGADNSAKPVQDEARPDNLNTMGW